MKQLTSNNVQNTCESLKRLRKKPFYSLKEVDFLSATQTFLDAVNKAIIPIVSSYQVRKANKLLGTLSGSVDQLPSKKMYSGQQIDDQKAR